uniref:Tachykinin precursor 3b n=1 Tax=Oncorhynchus kisutch TaxID=8019 RepID=A0A8C7CF51_ONCKI
MVGISPTVYTIFHLDSMMGNSWALAILILLVILISCPMESDCEEEFYNSKLQFRQDYLSGDLTHSKRYSDIDYDTFVGLMGRRSAADMDGVFLGLLGRRSSRSAIPQPWGEEYPQPRGGILINNGRLRFAPGV